MRVSDQTAFFYMGELVEWGDTGKIFSQPDHQKHMIISPENLDKNGPGH